MGKHSKDSNDSSEEDAATIVAPTAVDAAVAAAAAATKKMAKKTKVKQENEEYKSDGHSEYEGLEKRDAEIESIKRNKKKRKISIVEEASGQPEKSNNNTSVKMELDEDMDSTENPDDEQITFPFQDLPKLINRIEATIPENDTVTFKTREKKLNWNEIAFDEYSPEKCKDTWHLIQKRQRQYRLFGEVIADAKEWVKRPWKDYKGNKLKLHPNFPKRPLSSYMLFYLDKKDTILSENPGIKVTDLSRLIAQQYNELPEQLRNKYVKMSAKRKKKYEVEVEEFYDKFPEVPRVIEKPEKETKCPKKPNTPFNLFFEEQLKQEGSNCDRPAFRETCKENWKTMSEEKKLVWIDWALELQNKYEQEIKIYQSINPTFSKPASQRDVLTKEEKQLKERMDGKPEKPPNSAYSLYSRILLKSNELKEIDSKERMKIMGAKWKELPQEEKDHYRDKANLLMQQYKLDFATYLDSLTQEKREMVLKNTGPKRKIGAAAPKVAEQPHSTKRIKKKEEEEQETEAEAENEVETEAGPETKITDFSSLLGVATPETWNDMRDEEKAMYIKYIQKIKDHFDSQHQIASKNREASSSSDSDSDSTSSG